MRVLFVTMQYGRSYLQGTERYLKTLGECLRRRGHIVGYLAGDPLNLSPRLRLGEQIDLTEKAYALPSRGWMTVEGLSPAALAGWLKDWRPEVVHLANPAHIGVGIAEAARSLGLPLIVTTMDFWWVCPKATLLRPDGEVCRGGRPWAECIRCLAASHHSKFAKCLARLPAKAAGVTLAAFYARAALRGMTVRDLGRWKRRNTILSGVLTGAEGVIFPSRATWEAIGPRVGHNRWRIIPYGLSVEWFASPRTPCDRKIKPEELTIGYAGALAVHKGPHLLLEAVQRLGWDQTKIRLAGPEGTGDYMAKLRQAAQGLRVEFVGSVRPEDMPAFLRGLDVLAMTSVWPENLPFVVLEAQAAGVPVVASRLAGVADQIGDERLLFEPGSVEGLAAALTFVADEPGQVRLGSVSTAEEMTVATEEIYRSALAGQQGVRELAL